MSPHLIAIRREGMRTADEATMTRAAHATVFFLFDVTANGVKSRDLPKRERNSGTQPLILTGHSSVPSRWGTQPCGQGNE